MIGWYGVDLDGTAAEYGGWQGMQHIGAPVEKIMARIRQLLAEGKTVKIMTARVGQGVDAIERQLTRVAIQEYFLKHVGQRLQATAEKDFAMIELWDDRVKQVIPNTGEFLEEKYEKLHAAAKQLYKVARWKPTAKKGEIAMSAEKAARFWEELRDALGLEPGTATNLGVAP